jgi:HEAT repeat protein
MAVKMADVRAALDPDEPNYEAASALGPEAVPFLAQLVRGQDLLLAAKATYAAGRIHSGPAIRVLEAAAAHADPSVRVAAAGAAGSATVEQAIRVLPRLLTDADSGVRRIAVQSAAVKAGQRGGRGLREQLRTVGENDPNPGIRNLIRKLTARQ